MRARYQIVVLGNLDTRYWNKFDCFAPVMSQLEFTLMISLAVQMKVKSKQGDFTQEFCRSTLPIGERCVCSPPYKYTITPPKTYLLSKKTSYGLKRSPKYWFNKAK